MIMDARGRLLMVDDDPEDILLVKVAVSRADLPLEVDSVTDAEKMIPRLENLNKAPHTDSVAENLLILLDLNMPTRDGRRCLLDLKSDSRFSDIPVVVFSTSESLDDIKMSYRNRANSYICKPGDIDQLERILRTVYDYWFKEPGA